MDLPALLGKYGADTLLAGSFLLLSFSVYHARDAIRAWIEARAKGLSEDRARVLGEVVGEKVNGHLEALIDKRVVLRFQDQGFVEDIGAALGESASFRDHVLTPRIQEAYKQLRDDLNMHAGRVGETTDRLTALETDVKAGGRRITALEDKVDKLGRGLASHTGEIKAVVSGLGKKMDTQDMKLDDVLKGLAALNGRAGNGS